LPFPVPERRRGTGAARRVLHVLAVLVLLAASAVLTTTPARAATISAPVVIGLNSSSQVLAATGTAVDSYLTMTSYVPDGAPGASLQRWTFELLEPRRSFGYVYLIRNAASGLCMKPNAYFGMYLRPCNQVPDIWTMSDVGPPAGTGYWLRRATGNRLGECLSADARPPANPSRLNPDTCWAPGVGQRWRVRPGNAVCGTLDVTAVCSHFNPPQTSMMASWRQFPLTFDQTQYAQLSQYVGGKTVDGQAFDNVADWFEIGWRSTHVKANGTIPPTTVQEAYWQDRAPGLNQYHGLSSVPYGTADDGRIHYYMALASAGGKVDLLYDYNTVGTTTGSEGSRIGYVETGVMKWDYGSGTLPAGIEHRIQTMDPNGIWSRLPLAGLGLVNDRQCYGPSAGTAGLPLNPPNCIEPTVKAATGRTEMDYLGLAQPGAPTPVVPAAPARTTASTEPAVLNGVDQRALRSCMDAGSEDCLRTVPGLAECVAARARCNATGPFAAPANPTAMTLAQAKQAARRDLVTAGGTPIPASANMAARRVAASSVDTAPAARQAALPAGEDVIVVTGQDTVHGLRHDRHQQPYQGFRLVYRASTGILLDACLGERCFAENR
jgi:hypothetical protein